MQISSSRILTTHTGSLPRPASLVRLYVAKNRGEPVDQQLAAAGLAALEDAVRKQRDVGIDIGNNGEQQREAFFLYVRDRMSGFGGTWNRPPRADVERYPAFKAALERAQSNAVMISARDDVPTATGEVRYVDMPQWPENALTFAQSLTSSITHLSKRSLPHRPPVSSPLRYGTTTTRARTPISLRSAKRYGSNTKPSSPTVSCCSLTVPIWRWSVIIRIRSGRSATF
jgi:hypothetical protein